MTISLFRSGGGAHCPAVILSGGTAMAPLTCAVLNCSSTSLLASTIRISAPLLIFCNNSSMLMRGAKSEGAAVVLSDRVEDEGLVELTAPAAQPDKARSIKSDAKIYLKFILDRTSHTSRLQSKVDYSSATRGRQVASGSHKYGPIWIPATCQSD